MLYLVTMGFGNGFDFQKLFEHGVGYQKFIESLKSLGQPSKELLQTLLDLVF